MEENNILIRIIVKIMWFNMSLKMYNVFCI